MISKGNHVNFARFVLLGVKFFCRMYNKTIIRFGCCDIQNNQGLGKGYQLKPEAYLGLDFSGYHKNRI